MKKIIAAIAVAIGLVGGAVQAAPISSWNITYAGAKETYDLGNNTYLSLMGISSGAEAGVTYNTSDLLSYFGNGGAVTAAYYAQPLAPGAWQGSPDKFEEFGSTFEIATLYSADKLFDSFYIKYTATGSNFVYSNPAGSNSTQTISLTNAIDQNPLETPAVPLPAAAWMLIAGLGGLAAVGRRKAA